MNEHSLKNHREPDGETKDILQWLPFVPSGTEVAGNFNQPSLCPLINYFSCMEWGEAKGCETLRGTNIMGLASVHGGLDGKRIYYRIHYSQLLIVLIEGD